MAKSNLNLDSMFGELNKRAGKNENRSDAVPIVQQPISPNNLAEQGNASEKKVLQGKLAKPEKTQKKEYNYGTKRTFPIPDDLWNDALIVMQAQGLKQVEFIQGLIRDAVEANREMIIAVKKMRGEQ